MQILIAMLLIVESEMTTMNRSFRLDEKLLLDLSKAARKHGLTENQLVASWLASRMSIELFIPTFEEVMMSTETLESILNACNVDPLEVAAFELGKRHLATARILFEASGKQLTFVKFADEFMSKRAHWFRIESGETVETSEELVLQHGFGAKWSVFLKSFLIGAYEAATRRRLAVEITGSFLKLKLNPQADATSGRF